VVAEANIDSIIQEADALYDKANFVELFDFMQRNAEDAGCAQSDEFLWRYARAQYEKSNLIEKKADKKAAIEEALVTVKKALQLNEENFAVQKWCGILTSELGNYLTLKEKIQNSYVIRQYFDKAVELNPTDPTSRHLIGMWCFTFAELSWMEKKVAGALFAAPPDSSYQEALVHFEKAEALEPGFYKKNRFMVARCHHAMGNKDKARAWFLAVKDIEVKTSEDAKLDEQADFMVKYKC